MARATGITIDMTHRSVMAPEERLARLSRTQYGVVAKRQLLALGFSHSAIKTALRKGQLERFMPGVLRVASAPICWEQRTMGIILWGGEVSVASHLTSAYLQNLLDRKTGPVEITADRRLRGHPGIVARQGRLVPCEIVVVRSIPCTSVARTLCDLCHTCCKDIAERALDASLRMDLATIDSLGRYVEEAASRKVRGSAALRSHLSVRGDDEALSESELESEFARVMRKGSLPIGERQFPREGVRKGRIDLAYPEHGLVIELDGRKWHSGRREIKRDKRYDNHLNVSGQRVLRLTWEDLKTDEGYVIEIMARALGIQALF